MPLAPSASPLPCCSPAWRRSPCAQTAQPAIEKQMTPEEFKAAGLDKLSADELARLNAWLGRTHRHADREGGGRGQARRSSTRTAASSISDRKSRSPRTCSGEFRGFGKGRIYTLDNGQVWQQIDDAQMAVRPLDQPRGPDQAGAGRQQLVHGGRSLQHPRAGRRIK